MATTNFNYQVALKEGLKSLQQGRLRQAEQSFKYLVDKFPGAEGGYRGLAKVHFEQDDRAGALRILRDGAVALSRSGERTAAIALLREAVTLDARDLATHRRLAAALALTGDATAAVEEYARFMGVLRNAGEIDRAKAEAAYALGQLRDAPGIERLTQIAAAPVPAQPQAATEREHDGRPKPATSASEDADADPWARAKRPPSDEQLWARTSPDARGPSPAPANDPWARGKVPSPARGDRRFTPSYVDEFTPAPAASGLPPSFSEVTADLEIDVAVEEEARTEAAEETPAEAAQTASPPAEAADDAAIVEDEDVGPVALPDAEVEDAAARFLATRDPRAAEPALEAARRYIKDGRTDAASDLLLQLVASGVADHDAQRLLVEVARALGKRDVAHAKCKLLVQALLLDGRNDLAAEVEAMAQGD